MPKQLSVKEDQTRGESEPLSFYREKYGTALYGLNKLYLLMEKQHNRGQDGAGVGAIVGYVVGALHCPVPVLSTSAGFGTIRLNSNTNPTTTAITIPGTFSKTHCCAAATHPRNRIDIFTSMISTLPAAVSII